MLWEAAALVCLPVHGVLLVGPESAFGLIRAGFCSFFGVAGQYAEGERQSRNAVLVSGGLIVSLVPVI